MTERPQTTHTRKANTSYEEGKMTKLRSHYVCENALYEYSVKLGLNEYIKLGKGQLEQDGKHCKAIVADIFESFIAAMFLDSGLKEVKKFIYNYVIPIIESNTLDFFSDYKSKLQEFVQTDKKSLEYILVNEEGPAHNKTFEIEVRINGILYGSSNDNTAFTCVVPPSSTIKSGNSHSRCLSRLEITSCMLFRSSFLPVWILNFRYSFRADAPLMNTTILATVFSPD